jgi:nicotinamide riboside transporter PnuC
LLGVAVSFIFAIPVVKTAMGDHEKNGWAYWIKLVLNGTSLMLCIFAMQLALRAYREQWTLWMIANFSVLFLWLINIVEFAESNDNLSLATSIFTLFTFVLSTANSIFGYISWKKK